MKHEGRESVQLDQILDMQHIQDLNDSFAYAMDLASTVVDLRGNPIAGPTNHSEVCRLIRSTPEGLARCKQSAKILGSKAHETKHPYSSPCYSLGFVDGAAPIIIRGQHIATWLVGQADLAAVDEQRIIEFAGEIKADKNAMLKAFRTMTGISSEQFNKKLEMLWRIAQNVSRLGFNNYRYAQALAELQESQNELENYKNNLERQVEKRTRELKEALARVERLSITDHLTGCFNRMYLQQHLEREVKKAVRYRRCFSLIICDIDHFKRINDLFGHQCGDFVLIEIAKILQSCVRQPIDWVVRYGGEEFLLALPETNNFAAGRVAERLRKEIAAAAIYWGKNQISVTASFGIATCDCRRTQPGIDSDRMIMSADQNLYRAKTAGRNTVFGSAQ